VVAIPVDLDGKPLPHEEEIDAIGPDRDVAAVWLDPVCAHQVEGLPLRFGVGDSEPALGVEQLAQGAGAGTARVPPKRRAQLLVGDQLQHPRFVDVSPEGRLGRESGQVQHGQ
jgi:hypothetical protein